MFQHKCSIATILVSVALATLSLQGAGWLDRVVQYHKDKLFNELAALKPIKINAEIQPKPEGYKDSAHWDYDSVLRLLTLIRESESARPVHKALRRMLQPTRRLMMSMKESKIRFPSIKKDDNEFYYDGYDSSKENELPAPPPVPEDQVVLVVSNPVEARLPSARISVKLLRDILEARAVAARQLRTTTKTAPWIEFIRNRTHSPSTKTVATTVGGEVTTPADKVATTDVNNAGTTPDSAPKPDDDETQTNDDNPPHYNEDPKDPPNSNDDQMTTIDGDLTDKTKSSEQTAATTVGGEVTTPADKVATTDVNNADTTPDSAPEPDYGETQTNKDNPPHNNDDPKDPPDYNNSPMTTIDGNLTDKTNTSDY